MRDDLSSSWSARRFSSSTKSAVTPVYKLNIPERYSSVEDLSRTEKTTSTAPSRSLSSRINSFRSLSMPLRRHKLLRNSMSTTGTSAVTIGNDEEEEEEEAHDDTASAEEDDDIAILQPEELSASPEKKTRLWRSFSTMRMAISRSSRKPATTMYSISFFPWKRDPRAYYSHPEAAAEWVPDTASKRCQICLASFNLTRRRHHCRLCGLLICNDCSLARTYFPFSKDLRSHHHLIKDGAPQRTCNACAGTLKNMAAQNDPRVKKFTVHTPVADSQDSSDGVDSSRGSQWRVSIGDEDIYVIDGRKSRLQLALASSSSTRIQSDELDEILHARTVSRKNPMPTYFVISTEWLEQWLQYVHVDAPLDSRAASRHHRTHSSRSKPQKSRPGPISNYSLLNFVSGKLVPKHDLERSRGNDAGGDYRIVSGEVWNVFVRLYGGGPCIQLLPDDDLTVSTRSNNGNALIASKISTTNGSSSGVADPSSWIILELDDSMPPLASKEPSDLLKGNKKMRRAASASSLVPQSTSSMKHRSSVFPIRETTPCLASEFERTQTYYPRDSYVNCITSPPYSIAEEKQKNSSLRSDSLKSSSRQPWKKWRERPESVSSVSDNIAFSKVSVGTVLYEPSTGRDMGSLKSSELSTERATHDEGMDSGADNEVTPLPFADPRTAIAAVSAFAVAAAEARKKSALSLSRHPSNLSNSMTKSQPSNTATA